MDIKTMCELLYNMECACADLRFEIRKQDEENKKYIYQLKGTIRGYQHRIQSLEKEIEKHVR